MKGVRTAKSNRRSGVGAIEIVIAMAVSTMIIINISMVMRTGSKAQASGAFAMNLENQADQTMDRISLAIMSSDGDSVNLPAAPFSSGVIDYQVSLGIQGGAVVWSDPERIELVDGAGQVQWSRNPDTVDAQSVVWSNWLPAFLEGEDGLSLADDNANGLINETGLAFDQDRDLVTIRLSITRLDEDGNAHTRTKTAQVTCRN